MPSMKKISAVVLTKNEEDRIEKCLQSLQWVDEVVVFDSGSTDKTLEIAKTFDNVKVFSEPGWGGFGKQRQISKDVATGEWIFMVDADEVIPDTLRDEIKTKLAEGNLNKAYAIPRKVWVFGKLLKYCWYPDYVVRLYAKEKSHYKSEDLVHEKVYLNNEVKVKKLTNPLLHFTYRDLDHFLEKSNHYTKAWAEKYFKAGKRTNLFQAIWHSTCCFIKNYFVKLGFLDGKYGFLIAVLCAHSTFSKYACLLVKQWEKQQK
jgi:(heptosyl)LPS beta-1,4-glucosyltransferase